MIWGTMIWEDYDMQTMIWGGDYDMEGLCYGDYDMGDYDMGIMIWGL